MSARSRAAKLAGLRRWLADEAGLVAGGCTPPRCALVIIALRHYWLFVDYCRAGVAISRYHRNSMALLFEPVTTVIGFIGRRPSPPVRGCHFAIGFGLGRSLADATRRRATPPPMKYRSFIALREWIQIAAAADVGVAEYRVERWLQMIIDFMLLPTRGRRRLPRCFSLPMADKSAAGARHHILHASHGRRQGCRRWSRASTKPRPALRAGRPVFAADD